jgi:hypothetical protein
MNRIDPASRRARARAHGDSFASSSLTSWHVAVLGPEDADLVQVVQAFLVVGRGRRPCVQLAGQLDPALERVDARERVPEVARGGQQFLVLGDRLLVALVALERQRLAVDDLVLLLVHAGRRAVEELALHDGQLAPLRDELLGPVPVAAHDLVVRVLELALRLDLARAALERLLRRRVVGRQRQRHAVLAARRAEETPLLEGLRHLLALLGEQQVDLLGALQRVLLPGLVLVRVGEEARWRARASSRESACTPPRSSACRASRGARPPSPPAPCP